MKTKKLLGALLLIFAVAATTSTSHAQFGKLKNLKNVVKSDKSEKTQDAEPAATPQTPSEAPQPQNQEPAPAVVLTPTPEALASDPNAANETIEAGFTKSIGQLHCNYDLMENKQVFPFAPYYKYPDFFVMNTPENTKELEELTSWFFDQFANGKGTIIDQYEKVTLADGTEVGVPINLIPMNAYTTLYLADPSSIKAFEYANKALVFNRSYTYDMYDTYNGLINEQGLKCIMNPASIGTTIIGNQLKAIETAVNKHLDPTELREYIDGLADAVISNYQQKKFIVARGYWDLAMKAYERIYLYHKERDTSAPEHYELREKMNQVDGLESQIMEGIKNEQLANRPMPERATGVDNFQKTAISLAKTLYGSRFLDAYLTGSSWRTMYEGTIWINGAWVKKVVGRYMPMVIYYKDGEKIMRTNAQFVEDGSNSGYRGTYRLPLPAESLSNETNTYKAQ